MDEQMKQSAWTLSRKQDPGAKRNYGDALQISMKAESGAEQEQTDFDERRDRYIAEADIQYSQNRNRASQSWAQSNRKDWERWTQLRE